MLKTEFEKYQEVYERIENCFADIARKEEELEDPDLNFEDDLDLREDIFVLQGRISVLNHLCWSYLMFGVLERRSIFQHLCWIKAKQDLQVNASDYVSLILVEDVWSGRLVEVTRKYILFDMGEPDNRVIPICDVVDCRIGMMLPEGLG